MFDAGEAAQIAYMKSGLGWNKKMKLFVTHLHGDHCVGILGLLQTMSMQNRTEPLEIFGPKGIDEFLGANIKVLNFGLPFSILINIVNEGKYLKIKIFNSCNKRLIILSPHFHIYLKRKINQVDLMFKRQKN